MKKKKVSLLISSLIGSASIFSLPVAQAACSSPGGPTVTCSGNIGTPIEFSTTDQQLTIAPGTQLSVSAGNHAINFRGLRSTLINQGNITTTGDGVDAIWYFTNTDKSLINNGLISTSGNTADAIELSEIRRSLVDNKGTLQTSGDNSHGVNIGGGAANNTIINNATIVTNGANADGFYATNSHDNALINHGTITVNGNGSSGMFLGIDANNYSVQNLSDGVIYAPQGYGISVTENATVSTLLNSGVIDGGIAGIYLSDTATVGSLVNTGLIVGAGSGDGVVFTGSSNVQQFTNTGIIAALEGDAIRAENNIAINGGIDNQGIIIGRVDAAGSAMNNNGIFELRSNSAASNVASYNQTNSGALAVQANSASQYGQLTVNGDATLNGKTLVITEGSTNFANGDVLANVVTANSITGSPSAVLDDSLRYQFVQDQTATTYSLRIVDTGLTTVNNAVLTTTPNASLAGIGGVIDTFINSNNGGTNNTSYCNGALASTVCAITSSYDANQVHRNVVQLAPLMDGSMTYIEMNALRAFGDIVSNRQESVRGQGVTQEFNPEKYLWIRPVGRWDNQSSRNGFTGYNADTRGVAIGADGLVLDRTRLGLALGMSRTDVNDTSGDIRHDAQINSWNMLAYGSYDFTLDTALSWQAGFGRNTTKGNRYLSIENPTDGSIAYNGVAHSDYDSHTLQSGLGLQSTFHPAETVTLTPVLRTDYYRVKDKGYQETGAQDVGLKVDGSKTEALIISSKLKAGLKLSEIVNVHGYAGAGYDAMNDRSKTTAAFIGSTTTPFTYHGMSESPWIAMAGVGVTAKFSNVLDGTVQYDAEQRTKFTSQSVSLKVRYAF